MKRIDAENTLSLITTGTMPDAENRKRQKLNRQKYFNSLQQKENKTGYCYAENKKIHSVKQNKSD